MKVFFTLLLFSGFFSFGQESVDVVYRKLGLNACRCLNDSSIDEDLEAEFKKCDLLAYQNLSDTEKKQVPFDFSNQEDYLAFSAKTLSYKKDYCPEMIIRLENKKNDDLYIENQKKAKLAEQEKQAALLKSIEDEKRLSEENIKIDKEKILELEKLVEQLKLEIAQKNEIISNLTNKKNE